MNNIDILGTVDLDESSGDDFIDFLCRMEKSYYPDLLDDEIIVKVRKPLSNE